jgi:uncharacterized protein with von Willebrand factor type A (vWA) domain
MSWRLGGSPLEADIRPMPIEQLAAESLSRLVQGRLVNFVRLARANDFTVGVAEEVDAQRVAACCGIDDPEPLRWGLRSLLCAGRDDWERFDALFDAYWFPANASSRVQSAGAGRGAQKTPGAGSCAAGAPDQTEEGAGADAGADGARGGASQCEGMEEGDFQSLAETGQLRAAERLAESLARRMRRRLVRRERIASRGRRLNLRHTIRASLPYGGTPLQLAFRERRRRQPRLVVITDVSRSMAMYSLVFLRFARGIVTAFREADAFAVHTRLVPISEALREADTGRFIQRLALLSQGWSGGTRLGESLAALNRDHSRLLSRRTTVILVSDGLDTGEPATLGRELAAMRSRCRRIVWLNPLLGRAGYEPRTGAMLAALPHLDLFAPAHNLKSLAALEPVLAEC